MRNDLYTVEQAKAQARIPRDALIDAEGDESTSDAVLRDCARDYWNACAFAVNVELDHFRADCPPQDFTDDALADALFDELDLDEKHLKKLNAGCYTTLERIDAEFAVALADGKFGIVCNRKDRRPDMVRRGKRAALVHGDKIKTGKFKRINGERVPVLRTVRKS